MRYPPDHKPAVRARIVEATARALREEGLAAVSVPALMQRAGLTHGGFYQHFRDREALLVEAVALAAAETGHAVFDGAGGDLDTALATYLSMDHVAQPGHGCVVAALGAEAAHHPSPPIRRAFAAAARGLLGHVQRLLWSSPPRPRAAAASARGRSTRGSAGHSDDVRGPAALGMDMLEDEALALASRIVGAVVLARLVDDPALAARLLATARAPDGRGPDRDPPPLSGPSPGAPHPATTGT